MPPLPWCHLCEVGVGQDKPPGIGPQVLILGFIQGKPFWGYPIFDPQVIVFRSLTKPEVSQIAELEPPSKQSGVEIRRVGSRIGVLFGWFA